MTRWLVGTLTCVIRDYPDGAIRRDLLAWPEQVRADAACALRALRHRGHQVRAATYGAGVGLAALAGVMAAPMVKTQATVGRSFVDACVMRLIEGTMDPDTAAMAKLWTTETLGKAVDESGPPPHPAAGALLGWPRKKGGLT